MTGLDSRHGDRPPYKVVLVISSLQGGGAERVLSDMANYWAARGLCVTLATWSGHETKDFFAVDPAVGRAWLNVVSHNKTSVNKLCAHIRRVRKLRKLLMDVRPDVVVSFIDWSNVLTIVAARGLGVRLIVSERIHPGYNSGLSRPWKVMRKLLYRRAQAVVAQTDDAASWLRRKCGATTWTIPNPLRKLPDFLVQREPLILAVGRLSKQKGFDLLLRAFAGLCREFCSWQMMIVGAGPEKTALMKLRDDLGLETQVQFLEPIKDIELLMSRAGLVVQPSRFEGFPNVVLEAMGMGAPVISAECPSGPATIIQDNKNGRLVPVDDVAELAEAMRELLSQPDLRSRMGNEAMKVRQRFSQDVVMKTWEMCLFPDKGIQDPPARMESAGSYDR